MTQPFADALTWVPKSRALSATLGRAHDMARAKGHPAVTLEHVLLGLVEDPDASAVLLSCNIDLLDLNQAAAALVNKLSAEPAEMPAADPALLKILEYAVAAARQSKRSEINGAIVLAAIVGEGNSEAAQLLAARGVKFEHAVAALRKAAQAPRPAEAAPAAATAEAQAAPPVTPSAPSQPVAPPPPAAEMKPEPAVNGHYDAQEDPITTARRRIAAMRNGQASASASVNGVAQAAAPAAPSSEAMASAAPTQNGTDWAPRALAQASASPGPRPPRLPPPVPPVAEAPVHQNGAGREHAVPQHVPWSDASYGSAEPSSQTTGRHGPGLPPIDTAALVEQIPERVSAHTPATIEIKIPRGAVLSTAAAANPNATGARNAVITRALSVRLRAPHGGFHVENASPETQWFDTRSSQRDDDVVRWRWHITPEGAGRKPLQLSLVIRTVAADGMIVETILPEHVVDMKVTPNTAVAMRNWAGWAVAALAGAVVAITLGGGWARLLSGVFG